MREDLSNFEAVKEEADSLDACLQALDMACAALPHKQRAAMSWLVMMARDHNTHLRCAVKNLLPQTTTPNSNGGDNDND